MMADVKWIKLSTELFDNRKIRQIESLPDGDAIIVIWVKLLCLAGCINDKGLVYFTNEIPYTDQMLSTQFNRSLTTVQLALRTFEQFGMVEIIDDILHISNWEKYQNVQGMDKIREQTRARVAKYRAKQKELPENCNVTHNVTATTSNATDKEEDKEREEDIDKDIDIKRGNRVQESIDYSRVINSYNDTCVSFPRIRSLSDSRKKAIKARLHGGFIYSDFDELFKKTESSTFLKGKNARNWSATFDWLIKDANMIKVLEGNYDDKDGGGSGSITGNPEETSWNDLPGIKKY